MRQNWYQAAAGSHSNNFLSEYPIYHVPEPFRGYHIISEQAGIGLIMSEPLNNKDIAVAILSASVPEFTDNQYMFSLCFAREMNYDFWDKHKQKWQQLLTYLIALRTKGWLIQPNILSDNIYQEKSYAGTSISCPVSGRIEKRIPFFLSSNPLGLAMECHKYLQDIYYLLETPLEYQETHEFLQTVDYEQKNLQAQLNKQLPLSKKSLDKT